jgi:hypothetical protein
LPNLIRDEPRRLHRALSAVSKITIKGMAPDASVVFSFEIIGEVIQNALPGSEPRLT